MSLASVSLSPCVPWLCLFFGVAPFFVEPSSEPFVPVPSGCVVDHFLYLQSRQLLLSHDSSESHFILGLASSAPHQTATLALVRDRDQLLP